MAKIEVYFKPTCSFCVRVISLLDKKNVQYTKYDITGNDELRAEMIERAGGKTSVPEIFINDKFIGGCDDLHMLDANDELDALLNG